MSETEKVEMIEKIGLFQTLVSASDTNSKSDKDDSYNWKTDFDTESGEDPFEFYDSEKRFVE